MKEKFAEINDPRHQGYVKHKLCDILVIVMCAVICGLDKLTGIMTYAESKAEFFEKEFGITKIPSKSTVSRVLSIIDGQKVAEIMISIMKEHINEVENHIAVDGKAIRSTLSKGSSESALQIITAYLTESGIVMGQEKIHEKTNEIPVFQEMLSCLNIKDKIITADAMHCQKNTCEKIVQQGGHYIFGLKGNQGMLHEDVALFFRNPPAGCHMETFSTLEKNRGRLERRTCRKLTELDWLEQKPQWAGLRTVLAVERRVTKQNSVSEETSYYIADFDDSAEKFLSIIRNHWRIESMHWMLDVVFSEDSTYFIDESTHIALNALRKYALFLHRSYLASAPEKCSVKANMLKCLMNDSLILNVIASA